MKTLKQIREASGGKEAYQKFFNSMLKKFGVSSPSELEGKKKKEFFDAIDKGWDGDNEKAEKTETYTDPDDLDPETTHNPDELELATGKNLGEKVKKPNLVKVTEISGTEDEKLAERLSISEIYSRAQMKKAIGIARKSKGQYTKAYNAIEKIAKGLADEHIVANALKKANEAHEIGTDEYVKHCKKMVPGQNEAKKVKPPKQGDKDEYYRRVDKVNKAWGIGAGKKSLSDLSKSQMKKYFADRDAALGHTLESVKLTKWSVNEMTTEIEFDWDSYGFSKAKHNKLMRKHKLKVTPTTMKGPGGVDVDHFAKVVGRKEDIRAWMKDWGYDYDKDDYKDMGLALKGESVLSATERYELYKEAKINEANRYRKGLSKPSQIIMALVMKDIHRNRTTDPKEIDAVVDDIAGVSLTDKEVAQVKLAIRHESVVTIHISNELTEKLRAGRGNIKDVGVDLDATDYDGGERQYIKDVKKRFKVTVKLVRYGADLSGKKQDIIDFLQSDMYGGVEDDDIEDMWPDLLEAVDCDARLMGFKAAIRRKEGEKQHGRVIVDRRTKGAKAAALRSEKARAKREAARKQKEFAEKYPQLDYQYGNDADLEEILNDSNRKLFGETAANSVASGNVDMAPNMGKKKKKDKVIKRDDY